MTSNDNFDYIEISGGLSVLCSEKKSKVKNNDESFTSATSIAQVKVEECISLIFSKCWKKIEIDPDFPELLKSSHILYLNNCLTSLPGVYEGLDCSRAWLCYWICHSLALLKHKIDETVKTSIADFLGRCQCEEGGFGGGPGQYPHLAPTYAAVNALCTLGTVYAYKIIDRPNLVKFLWSVRVGDGSFKLHPDGEIDIRGVYCALIVAKLTNLYTESLFEHTAEWVARCQTYEGGFSCVPGMEAHGGYSFCAIASLYLMSCHRLCDVKALLRWTANRQMSYEGGFQGRTNKLVDGCYSFWQGGAMSLIYMILVDEPGVNLDNESWLFHSRALQEYILICCQDKNGGLSDKPNLPRDPYHTCYTLSGLSVAQNLPKGNTFIIGTSNNLLDPINPIFNLGLEVLKRAKDFFGKLEVVTRQINQKL